MRVVFWNVHDRVEIQMLVSIANDNNADILLLAEFNSDVGELVQTLNSSSNRRYTELRGIPGQKITAISTFGPDDFDFSEQKQGLILHFRKPGFLPTIIACVHLPSKRESDEAEADQAYYARDFALVLRTIEQDYKHSNTLIIGDFNMNPWESGMMDADAFNSIPCLKTAPRSGLYRVFGKSEYSFFYNPTWNLLGDWNGAPGSFFYGSVGLKSLYWNMFDQIIMRPDMAERLNKDSFRILTSSFDANLLNNLGRPGISDHLPIYFELDLSVGDNDDEKETST
ncbi:MAG: hypothetical protein NUW37_16630 [Planctomycetes bacterium]|nr:hypothetical protein [Planctomycetota bacterium]